MRSALYWFSTIVGGIACVVTCLIVIFVLVAGGFGTAPTALLVAIGGLLLVIAQVRRTRTNAQSQKRWTAAMWCIALSFTVPIALRYYLQIPPSDEAMLAQFNKHEASFHQLADMFIADQDLSYVTQDGIDYASPQDKPIGQPRLDLYRRLERDAKVPGGLLAWGAGEIEFEDWRAEFGLSGIYSKGFAYLPTPPKKTHPQLDGFQFSSTASGQTVYRRIRGNWYLYYDCFHPSF